MEEKVFVRLRDWVEPAHPAVVHLFDDLIAIYKYIREKYQVAVDRAFDEVSRQIGFVVTTTVPVVFEMGKEGKIGISMGAEHLKGTLFDKALSEALCGKAPDPSPWRPGTYKLYLLWYDALKLKLRTDWLEPAHFLKERLAEVIRPELATRVSRKGPLPWVEPAHWFDPGMAIAVEEVVIIEAIDEVYPELKLVDRVAASRAAFRRPVRPEVKEPAHFRQWEQRMGLENPEE